MTPASEYSERFWEGMLQRMGVSFHKYGPCKQSTADNLANIRARIAKYEATGNTEYLMDAANFAMIEFMHPTHPEAHFESTDDSGSPGLIFHGSSRPRRGVDNRGDRIR